MYVASFIIGIAATFLIGPDLVNTGQASQSFLILQVLISFALGFAGAWWFFATPSIVPSAISGVRFGGVAVATGFVLDFLLFIPGMLAGYTLADLASFYMETWFWFAIVLMFAGTALAGHVRARTYISPMAQL